MDTKDEITKAARRFIIEAMDEYSVTDIAAKDAIRQAVFRAIGYTEAAVISEATRRMEPNRAKELRRHFANENEPDYTKAIIDAPTKKVNELDPLTEDYSGVWRDV